MVTLTDVVILDGEDTPVSHTFEPYTENNGVARFVEAGSTLVGNNILTMSTREASGGSVKVRIKLDMPVTQDETINGISNAVIVRTAYADVTFSFAATSTASERRNAIILFKNALDIDEQSLVSDILSDLKGFT